MLSSLTSRALKAFSSLTTHSATPSPAPASPAGEADEQVQDASASEGKQDRERSVASSLTELSERDMVESSASDDDDNAAEAEEDAPASPTPPSANKLSRLSRLSQLPTPSPSSTSFSSAKLPSDRVPSSSVSAAQATKTRTTRAGRGRGGEEDDESRGADGKEYLLQGLYYSPGITPSPSALASSLASSSKRKSLSSPSAWRALTPSSSTAFPPPIHHGLTLIEDEHPFRLSFDILRDHYDGGALRAGTGKGKEREGKGGDKTTLADIEKRERSRKPEPYRHISRNVYVDRKPDRALIPAVCMCTPPTSKRGLGCGESCINRMMQYCCDPKLCPCGDQCTNLPLNKREGVPEGKDGLRVIWTGNRGFGIKTMVPIRKGQFVIEYRGEIISRDESYRRVLVDYKDRNDYHIMDYDGFEVIDAGQRGNSSRFINHSCGPNCHVVRWRLAAVEEYQMGIFAVRDIAVGEELSYNYGWQNFVDLRKRSAAASSLSSKPDADADADAAAASSDLARQRCFCGSPVCSGYLGAARKGAAEDNAKKRGKRGPVSATKAGKRKREDTADDEEVVEEEEEGGTRGEREADKVEWVQAKVAVETNTTGQRKKQKVDGGGRGSVRDAAARAKQRLSLGRGR
ncbi:hypothetical protein JCM1841_001881 [Sporobolomyces salmonicolor]